MNNKIFISLYVIILLFSSKCLCQIDDYYYYSDKKIQLEINENTYYILLSDTMKFHNMLISRNLAYSQLKTGINYYQNKKYYWKIIEFHKNNRENLYINKLLMNQSKIEKIEPVIGKKFPVAVSEYFYIKLRSQADSTLLKEIANKYSCEIVSSVKHMPNWYTLRAPRESSALNISNKFYSTNKFEKVDPGFVFNFSNNCITDENFYQQWGLKNSNGLDVDACKAWEITLGSDCIVVAVVDKGIDINHNEFENNLYDQSYDAQNYTSPAQLYGAHGTHVAGIIGANQNSNQISGISPQTSLMPISHSLNISSTMSEELASGISWAWQNGADIINNSWGDQGGAFYNYLHSSLLEDAIEDAIFLGRDGLGCVLVFASGNFAPKIDYPAYYRPEIICVGSIESSGYRSSTSGYGSELDVVAPGVGILSTVPNNELEYMSGTSMATPFVSGIASLILSIRPDLNQNQVSDIIELSSQKVGNYTYNITAGRSNGTWNNQMGYGLVNAYEALKLI